MEESDFIEINNEPENAVEEELDITNPEHAFALIEKEYNKVNLKHQFKLYILGN